MLDLEVVPERSLGNEQWEFVLGKYTDAQSKLLCRVSNHEVTFYEID